MAAVVVALLRGPLSGAEIIVELGLRAVGNLAVSDDSSRLLGAAGACDGEKVLSRFVSFLSGIPLPTSSCSCPDCLIVLTVVVMAVLRGPFYSNTSVIEQGLWAIRNLAVRDDNSRLLGTAGACEGDQIVSLLYRLSYSHSIAHTFHVFMFVHWLIVLGL